MTAKIINGQQIAADIQEEVRVQVEEMKEKYGYTPGLATVLVGENPASQTYVRMKQKRCLEVGINSFGYNLPVETSQAELKTLVAELNAKPEVNGILVQLPLPDHIDEETILNTIDLGKDVDGFHPVNIGRLAMKGRNPLFIPCTPYGVMELLKRSDIKLSGADAVIVGRSNIVGLPVAMLLQKANATVTICHSRTKDLPGHVRRADIVVAAIGRREMITGDMIKPGAAVIDVGINQKEDPTKKRGYRLVGDVEFESASQVAGAITPVPRGVGPMTIAMLMKNTAHAAELVLAAE
jgi:5,10-methylene-tetrahydrofolate dehydrogenase/methenyl tetrahydrofolate cyclohydrolase